MMAKTRLRTVREHLMVVLRSQQSQPAMSDKDFADKLTIIQQQTSRTKPPSDVRKASLQYSTYDVAAVFSLKPPAMDSGSQHACSQSASMLGVPITTNLNFVSRLLMKVRNSCMSCISAAQIMLKRTATRLEFMSYARWGLFVPTRIIQWLRTFGTATPAILNSNIYDSDQYVLESMCVAKHLRGQGVGKAIISQIQGNIKQEEVLGMRGICQSEGTKCFYEKCGFRSDEVLSVPCSTSWRKRTFLHDCATHYM